MKLTIMLIILSVFHVSAESLAQKVTLQERDASLQEVFSSIKEQTGYNFVFEASLKSDVSPINIDVKEVSLQEALDKVLAGQNFNYQIVNKTIVVKAKKTGLEQNLQVDTLKGVISDENGNPLQGVTVRETGTNNVVSSDNSGSFQIILQGSNRTLVFSSIGFAQQVVKFGERNNRRIILKSEIAQLEEAIVVSTGYQRVDRDKLTGAASVIGANVINQRTMTNGNLLEGLEGQLPGLVFNYRNPNTPQDEQLSIRGVATFDGVKSPLIVIDGFPTEIDINTINPSTVASVSVLRDAAASTIYGARAANGVIVIETKKGQKGKPKFTFRSIIALQSAPDFSDLNLIGSDEYIEIKKARALASNSSRPPAAITQRDPVTMLIFDQKDGLISEAEANQQFEEWGRFHNQNQYKDLFYRTSLIQNYELGMSGGGDNSQYQIGLNYIDNKTNRNFNNNDRLIFNLNNRFALSDRFTLDLSAIYKHERSSSRGTIPSYEELVPYKPIVDENGNSLPHYNSMVGTAEVNNEAMALGLYDRWRYPYQDFLTERNSLSGNTLRTQFMLNSKIVDGITLNLGGAYELDSKLSDVLYDESNYEVRDLLNRTAQLNPATGTALYTHVPQGDRLQKINGKAQSYTLRGQLNANYVLGNNGQHEVSGLMGIEVRKIEAEDYLSSFFGYNGQTLNISPVDFYLLSGGDVSSGFPEFRFGTAYQNINNHFDETHDDRRFRSYYSQATYIYNKKYIATGSVRLDQSNLFGTDPNHRNKPQWSGGLSWLLHRENFMQSSSRWLNELKIRASYGLTGNIPTSNSGKFLIFSTFNRTILTPASPYNRVQAPENQSLRWENTRNFNLGGDFSLLGRKITGSIDWYKKSTDQVMGSTLADPTSGFLTYKSNTASIVNKGMELWVNSRNINGENFGWTTNLTASINKNIIEDVYITNPYAFRNTYYVNTSNPIEGYALNSILSYRYAGLDETGIPTMITQDGTVQTISSSSEIFLEDLVNSGTTTPTRILGLGNHLRFGDFEFFAMLMYYGGHVTRVQQPNIEADYPLRGSSDYWKSPGDELHTSIPGIRPNTGFSSYSFGLGIYNRANQFIRKADQIRLTDVTVSWNLNPQFLRKANISGTQLRFQAQNIWKHTFSGNDIDMDAINPTDGVRGLHAQPIYSISLITKF